MKAVKYFILFILPLCFYTACKPPDQAKQSLDPTTKAYFQVRDNSSFTFTEYLDTGIDYKYTSKNYINNQANPDIENSEIMVYDLEAPGQPSYTIRCESGGAQFKDRIALITKIGDSLFLGPIVFNIGGVFTSGVNSYDSIFQYPVYNINTITYTDVVRVKLYQNAKYFEAYFAKNIGLVALKEKNNSFRYVKSFKVNK